jgi:hypothetical protein
VDTPAPAALSDLIAAGLVSHEMIGDPAKLGGEAGCLRALCALINGPVYRVEAYHYAFRAEPGDPDGRLATLAPGEWTDALETALCASLGEDAVWLNATDLLPEADAALAQPILLLRAQDAAISGALESAGPEIQAVVNARYAAECARLTVEQTISDGAGERLASQLVAIEERQRAILEGLAIRDAATQETLTALSRTLARVLDRLDAQAEALNAHMEHEARAPATQDAQNIAETVEAFRKTLGLTLAEFLARIEQRSEEDRAAIRISQSN